MKKNNKIPFFITIDNEEDNGWSRPSIYTTKNSKGLPRFQSLCEKYGFKPIYLTSYEMAKDIEFVKFIKPLIELKKCEIGMHPHAWNTPPLDSITGEDYKYVPYLIDYSDEIMYKKLITLDNLLKKTFNVNPISHRAGRWSINEQYLNMLVKMGYKIDCSYTPKINWKYSKSVPNGKGGTDYSNVPMVEHRINTKYGEILEIPMTTKSNPFLDNILIKTIIKLFSSTGYEYLSNGINARRVYMLRPRPNNLKKMMRLVDFYMKKKDSNYLMMMIHSSELYYGTSPLIHSENELNIFYEEIEKLFKHITKYCYGSTFIEYLNGDKK